MFLFFGFLLYLLSSLLTSCLFLGCMFLSLLIFLCPFLLFPFCCSHPWCPLLMYSLIVFVGIVPTFPSSASSFSYFFFFFLLFLSLFLLSCSFLAPFFSFCLCTVPTWHPPKRHKNLILFYWKKPEGRILQKMKLNKGPFFFGFWTATLYQKVALPP